MGQDRPVLAVGDRVSFDGEEYLVVGLAGTSVRLRSAVGAESVVLASHLLAKPDFMLLGNKSTPPSMVAFGLLDSLPEPVIAAAREWEAHLVEVETGLPSGAAPGTPPRPEYDPALWSLTQRAEAKAAELGVTARTVHGRRARYAAQGLWGLVDQRMVREWEAAGRADARLVEVIRQVFDAETNVSTGTRSRLIRKVVKTVEAIYGPGVVPLPGRSTFYTLIDRLSVGRHTFGSAVTRRQTANRPKDAFTPTFAARPGEQVQIDSTPIDVMVLVDTGVAVRADLTIAVDVATRTICAALLRPVGTKAVDAALLLARMLVPEPMRPGWNAALRMSVSRIPHARLLDIDTRMAEAAAKPVIVPDTIVIDGGKVFISEVFIRACDQLGVSVQRCRPDTPTDKAIVEATFDSINSLFCQHVAAYTGSNVTLRGKNIDAAWQVDQLQDLFDEWLIVGWQHRPHDSLRDPFAAKKSMSPNDKYASLVAAAGYLPLVLAGQDYLELLPVAWRQINDYGIQIDYRTYDSPDLGPLRRQHSGVSSKRGLWEVHYDPYDVSQVFVRTTGGWITVGWTHRSTVTAPFADFTWRYARKVAAEAGLDHADETAIARVLDELLTRAEHGPDTTAARVIGRTRSAASARLPLPATGAHEEIIDEPEQDTPIADVIPMGIFDADAEAQRWR